MSRGILESSVSPDPFLEKCHCCTSAAFQPVQCIINKTRSNCPITEEKNLVFACGSSLLQGEGGGGNPIYKLYRKVGRPKLNCWVSAPFWSVNRYRLCLVWSTIGLGTTRECLDVFIVSIPNEYPY